MASTPAVGSEGGGINGTATASKVWTEAQTRWFSLAFLGILVYLVDEYLRLSQCYPALRFIMFGKVVVGFTLLTMLFGPEMGERVPSPVNWVMVAFAVAMLVSYPASRSTEAASIIFSDYLKVLVGYFLIIKIVNTRWRLLVFLTLLLLINLKMSQFQIRNFSEGMGVDPLWTGIRGYGAGSTGLFGNACDFGVAMCTVLPIALAIFLGLKDSRWRWLGLVASGFFFYSILCTSSRGAALGLAAVGGHYWLRSKRKIAGIIFLLVAAAIFWGMAPDSYKERVRATNTAEDTTGLQRLDLWSAGVRMFVENPLTGVGIGNFSFVYSRYYRTDPKAGGTAPHNIFIQAGAELGLPGLLCLLSGIGLIFATNAQTRRRALESDLPDGELYANLARGLEGGLVGFLVSGFFLTVLYYPHFYMLAALTVILSHLTAKRLAEAGALEAAPAPRPVRYSRAVPAALRREATGS